MDDKTRKRHAEATKDRRPAIGYLELEEGQAVGPSVREIREYAEAAGFYLTDVCVDTVERPTRGMAALERACRNGYVVAVITPTPESLERLSSQARFHLDKDRKPTTNERFETHNPAAPKAEPEAPEAAAESAEEGAVDNG